MKVDAEKVHAVVARSTCRSQNAQSTRFSDHLEVEMFQKCTLLWHKAYFEVKMYKTHRSRNICGSGDVEKVHAVVARSKFPSQNAKDTTCLRHFWTLKRRFVWQAQRILHPAESE